MSLQSGVFSYPGIPTVVCFFVIFRYEVGPAFATSLTFGAEFSPIFHYGFMIGNQVLVFMEGISQQESLGPDCRVYRIYGRWWISVCVCVYVGDLSTNYSLAIQHSYGKWLSDFGR